MRVRAEAWIVLAAVLAGIVVCPPAAAQVAELTAGIPVSATLVSEADTLDRKPPPPLPSIRVVPLHRIGPEDS